MSLEEIPGAARFAFTAALGLIIGSFLNVAIHRLPREGQSVGYPRRSRCPSCGKVLTWRENIPLLSWIAQTGRCRGCKWRIPLRYPLVELLTATLLVWIASRTLPESPHLFAVHALVACGLIVATFVDFEHFEIPDEVSIGGMVAAPICSLLAPALHDGTVLAQWLSESKGGVDRAGALAGCLAGMATGAGVLYGVGWLGKRLYGREAMGLGDVKLLCAGGGFVGPGGCLASLLLAALLASVAGIGNILRILLVLRARDARRGRHRTAAARWKSARVAGRYLPFGPYLAAGIGIALFCWNDVRGWLAWS